MLRRFVCCLMCMALLAPAVLPAWAEEPEDSAARARVAEYAMRIHDYTWELPEEKGVLLVYNCNYDPRTSGFRLVFPVWSPYVVYGTVRGVPYSLASYGNGKELTFEQYQQLDIEKRIEISNIFKYLDNGNRVCPRYGMACATFVTECLKQGLTDPDLPIIHGVKTLFGDKKWKRYFDFGKHGRKEYPRLRTGDVMYQDKHVMLVMENDAEGRRLHVMEQTPPDYAAANCENMSDVTVTLVYRGKPTTVEAKRLCMECDACRQSTTGTQYRWVDYDELGDQGYVAVFVKY